MPWRAYHRSAGNDLSTKVGNKISREEKLTAKGWTKQSTHDEPRLSEMKEMYEEIGFEVHMEPFNPDNEPGCSECMKPDPDRYKTIYTKQKD